MDKESQSENALAKMIWRLTGLAHHLSVVGRSTTYTAKNQ